MLTQKTLRSKCRQINVPCVIPRRTLNSEFWLAIFVLLFMSGPHLTLLLFIFVYIQLQKLTPLFPKISAHNVKAMTLMSIYGQMRKQSLLNTIKVPMSLFGSPFEVCRFYGVPSMQTTAPGKNDCYLVTYSTLLDLISNYGWTYSKYQTQSI